MFDFQPPDASERFRIYLNDHRALLAAERSVAQRSRDANAGAAMSIDDDVTTAAAMRAESSDQQHVSLGEHHVEAVREAFETGGYR